MVWLLLLWGLWVVWPNQVHAHAYRNCGTTEAAHNSDALVYLCEDFEVNGTATVNGKGKWYAEDGDTASANGGITVRTKGWRGTIFANPITPDGAETCSIAVPAGSCAGNHYTSGGAIGGRNMADHSLFTGEPGTATAQNHVFVRYYQKWASGYLFGAEKVLTFNRGAAGVGGIWWGNLHMNCGGNSDGTSLTSQLTWQPAHSSLSGCQNITTGDADGRLDSGLWYAIQIELDLGSGSSDGTLRAYVDSCGANGDQCTGTPTLRMERTGISFSGAGTDNLMSIWWENWANAPSDGESYIDQIVVRDGSAGLIPFVGVTAGATTYGLFLSSWAGWLITLNAVLQLCMLAGYFWQQRAAIEKVAVMVWRYALLMPTPHDLYWTIKYRNAVKRWQQQAPKMLPPPTQTIDVPTRAYQERER